MTPSLHEIAEQLVEAGIGDTGGFSPPDLVVLRAVIDAAPARAAFIDAGHRYRYVNHEFLEFVGRSGEKVIGRHVAEVLGQDSYDVYRDFMLKSQRGQSFRWEGWMTFEGQGRRYVQESFAPYAPDAGPVQGVIAFGRDLTDLRQREHELLEEIADHAAVVASALDCIIVIDADGCVVEFNPSAETTFGYSRDEAFGRPIADLVIPPEMRERHAAGLRNYVATGVSTILGRRIELEAVHADGSRLPVELTITEAHSPKRRLFTAHLRDLTETHRARDEIERQREAIYQIEKLAALGSLLAGVAHELNNPLSIVMGQALMLREAAEALNREAAGSNEFANRAAKIEAAACRCVRVVRTFLAMARQRDAKRQEVKASALVDSALELLAYGLRTAGVEVTVEASPDLPLLWADGDQLHQVLVNLIVNAKQALEEAASPRRIMISVHEDRPQAQLVATLADNGPGVPENIRSRIFDPFFTTKPQGVGTGVGLAISRGLIEANGGSLLLAPSAPGSGATFVIRLPVAVETHAAPSKSQAAGDEPGRLAPPPRRALVIDDEVEIAALLAEMLKRFGFACDLASSGSDAQSLLAGNCADYDLILCDIRMPDGDGPALFEWLESQLPHLTHRIAFITGDTLGPAAGRFLARSGCPVVEKPFVTEDIRRIVELLAADAHHCGNG